MPSSPRQGGGTYATPAARRLAVERGLHVADLVDDVKGRVSLGDVIAARSRRSEPVPEQQSSRVPAVRDSLATLSARVAVHDVEDTVAVLVHAIIQGVHAHTAVGRPGTTVGLVTYLPESERHTVLSLSQDLSVEGVRHRVSEAARRQVTDEPVVVHDVSALGVERGSAPLRDAELAFHAGAVRETLALRTPHEALSISVARVLDLTVTYDSCRTGTRHVAAVLDSIVRRMAASS